MQANDSEASKSTTVVDVNKATGSVSQTTETTVKQTITKSSENRPKTESSASSAITQTTVTTVTTNVITNKEPTVSVTVVEPAAKTNINSFESNEIKTEQSVPSASGETVSEATEVGITDGLKPSEPDNSEMTGKFCSK